MDQQSYFYIRQAPQVDNQLSIRPQGTGEYQPAQVSAGSIGADALDQVGQHLGVIAATAQTISDYNFTTQATLGAANINNQAIINHWTPEQYQAQMGNFMNGLNFPNPTVQANLVRTIGTSALDTSTKLTVQALSDQVSQASANLDALSKSLQPGIHDMSSYMGATATYAAQIQGAVGNHLLTPAAGQKLLDDFRAQGMGNIAAAQMSANPKQFVSDLNSGKYDGFYTADQKQQLITNANNYGIKQSEDAVRQQQLQNANDVFKYSQAVNQNPAMLAQIEANPNIPLEVKTAVAEMTDRNLASNPKAINNGVTLMGNLAKGQFSSLAELNQWVATNPVPTNVYLAAASKYIGMNGGTTGNFTERPTGTPQGPTQADFAQLLESPILKSTLAAGMANFTTHYNILNPETPAEKNAAYNLANNTNLPTNNVNPAQWQNRVAENQKLYQANFINGVYEAYSQSGGNMNAVIQNLPNIERQAYNNTMFRGHQEYFTDWFNSTLGSNVKVVTSSGGLLSGPTSQPLPNSTTNPIVTYIGNMIFNAHQNGAVGDWNNTAAMFNTMSSMQSLKLTPAAQKQYGVSSVDFTFMIKQENGNNVIYIYPKNPAVFNKMFPAGGQ